jgi:hypothetical protein
MQLAVRITLSPASPEPTYTGGPFVSGVAQLDTANPPTADWQADRLVECGAFGERVDIATGGNYGQLLDSEMQISNHDKWFAAFQAAGAALEGALVEIGEALSSVDMTTRWTGTIADANFQGGNVEIRVESILASRHSMIPARLLTAQEFPDIKNDADGSPVAIIYNDPERMTPPSLMTNKQYQDCFFIGDPIAKSFQSTFIPSNASITAPTTTSIPLSIGIKPASGSISFPIWVSSGDYIEIAKGTGAGQIRAVASATTSFAVTVGDKYLYGLNLAISIPFDTVPDSTSEIKVFRLPVGAVLAVCDEGTLGPTYDMETGVEIPSLAVVEDGIVKANIATEFVQGKDYIAAKYTYPSDVFGVATCNDGDASIPASPTFVRFAPMNQSVLGGPFGDVFIADSLCKASIHSDEFPKNAIDVQDIRFVVSLKLNSPPPWASTADLRVAIIGFHADGTQYDYITVDPSNPASGTLFNSFSPSFIPIGGETGVFASYSAVAKLPNPLVSYDSILACAYISPTSGSQALQNTSQTRTFAYDGTAVVNVYPHASGYFSVGDKIRPARCYDDETLNKDSFYTVRDGFNQFIGGPYGTDTADRNWRTVQAINATTIDGQAAFAVTMDSPFSLPVGKKWWVVSTTALDLSAYEAECGIAFSFGTVAQDSTFLVDAISGRTYSASWPALPSGKANGDPITLARDAALDMYYRDLGLGSDAVDFASFQALPADPIRSALVARVDSAQRMADLCQQFNWVVGHDSDGRETATAWLSRVGSEDYDYSIDTGDVVEGTLTGVAVSDITDLINCPNFKYDWTQADGFRQESNVVDVTADPLTLNSGNYLRYLTGFGDFATALDVYESLHASYKISNRKNTGSFELPDVADASGVLWPLVGMDRFNWMASRKPLLVLTVPDTHAAAFPTVGKRARVRHKRYAPAWVYGTVVQWEHDPMEAETEIVVMVDPGALAEGLLYVDTIDPSGVVPLYTDMADGTTEQYIDQTGA